MHNRLTLITGETQTGKSTLCKKLAQGCRAKRIKVTGMITQQPTKHSLQVMALHTTERFLLTYPFESELGIAMTHFRMNPTAMRESTELLSTSFPTQVFILDELGPLELLRGEGWISAINLLASESYQAAFIVVRPALLSQALQQLPGNTYNVAHVTVENRDSLTEVLLQQVAQSVNNFPVEASQGAINE